LSDIKNNAKEIDNALKNKWTSMLFFDEFIFNILLAGVGVAVLTGVMGCFVVWKRMAYFGDSLSHSALLGVVIGIITGLQMHIAIIGICFSFAMILVYLQQKKMLSTDTLLGILAHGSLSFGMVAFSFLDQNIDLQSFLFGDILTVNMAEIYWLYGGGMGILAIIYYHWASLLITTISEELATAEGVNVFYINVLFMVLMTLIVALSMRIIGVLLMTSLLIIPAATARQFATSPKQMIFYAIFFGILSVVGGLWVSLIYDTPSSPTIVCVATTLFIALLPFQYRKN
jgi:zinc transport system permease protein